MKNINITIGLLFLCLITNAQYQLTNFGNLRIFSGAIMTSYGDFNNIGILTVDSSATFTNNGTLTNAGTIANTGTFVHIGPSVLVYSGTIQQTIGSELPNSNGPSSVVINNSNGVVLGKDATVNDLTFTSGNLNISGRSLTINGSITNTSGAITGGTTANLTFTGNSGTINFDQTNSSTRTLNNFTINKSSSTLTLGNAVEVTGNLNLNNGTFATGGNLKLVSNANGTATIPEITGTGAITGNATIERYVPVSARRWRFMSSNISGTTLEDWRGEIFLTGAGTGTTVGTQNSNGFDATISNSPSIYYYDETASGNMNYGWVPATSTSSSLTVGNGYRVFVRGDRSSLNRLNGIDNSQNEVTMNLIGTVNTGNISMPVTYTNHSLLNDDGWNFLGNPYPCQYDWYSFWNAGNAGNSGTNYTNISPTIYVWDATSNTYKFFNALTNSGTITNGILASGQGFMVKATGSSPGMTFKEQFKTSGAPRQMFKSSSLDEMHINLQLDSIDYDDFILKYNDSASIQNDVFDVKKWINPTVNISSFGIDSILHALDVRPTTTGNDTINLNITGSNGTFKMTFNVLPSNGKYYFLEDMYLSNTALVSEGSNYTFSISSSIAATQGNARFRIITSNNNSLPVSFGSFNAIKVDKQVQLNWNTLSEINSSRFEIERSNDHIEFISIGVLKAKGNSNIALNYIFMDEQPSYSSINYYRIKQIDANENFTYSGVRNVSFNLSNLNSEKLSVYPNPAVNKISLFGKFNTNTCIVSVYSVEGVLVENMLSAKIINGEIVVDVSNLNSGIYFIQIKEETGENLETKFLKE